MDVFLPYAVIAKDMAFDPEITYGMKQSPEKSVKNLQFGSVFANSFFFSDMYVQIYLASMC